MKIRQASGGSLPNSANRAGLSGPPGESGIRFPYICPYLKSIRQDCGKRI